MNKAVFLDRDGTLIEEKDYLYRVEEVRLLPGTFERPAETANVNEVEHTQF